MDEETETARSVLSVFAFYVSVSRNLRLPEEAAADWWSHPEAPRAAAQNHLHHSGTVAFKDVDSEEQQRPHLSVKTMCLCVTCSFHQLRTTARNDGSLSDSKSLCSTAAATHTAWRRSSARSVRRPAIQNPEIKLSQYPCVCWNSFHQLID